MADEKPRSILRQREPFQYSGTLEDTDQKKSDTKGRSFWLIHSGVSDFFATTLFAKKLEFQQFFSS